MGEPTKYDPDRWPLAPGNASPEMEAALQREAEKWPEPTQELRDKIAAVFRQADRAARTRDRE